ncbi:hypothetical protein QTV49_004894 [Vibrio vulnificus]|nr:hypothetical protein [Vibrio vulnificus]
MLNNIYLLVGVCFPWLRGLSDSGVEWLREVPVFPTGAWVDDTSNSSEIGGVAFPTGTWVSGAHPLFLWMLRRFSYGFMGYRGEVGVKFHRGTTLVSHDYMSFRQEGTPL